MKSLAITMLILASSVTAHADTPKAECAKNRNGTSWNSRPPEVVTAERLRPFEQVSARQTSEPQSVRTTR